MKKEAKANGKAVKAFCTCKSEYQDKVHGKGVRVHNLCNKGVKCCTVCKSEKA